LKSVSRSNGGSSSSLDSKDSKSGKLNNTPSVIEDHEKKWFKNSAKCDLGQLKDLLEKDCELLNKKDYFTGFAAVHWAAKKGRCDVISWLYDQKAEMNIRTNGGYTSLHIATIHKQEGTIQKLITSFDADINIRDYSGKKARHYLSPNISAAVTRALQETPSVLEMKLDPNADLVSMEGYSTPTAIRKNIRKPLVKSCTLDRGFGEETGGFRRMRKKGLSLSNSFKMRKKSTAYIMKRENSVIEEDSPTINSRWQRSPSVPDIVLATEKDSKTNKRKSSVVEYTSFIPLEDDVNMSIGRNRKNSVSDMYINGYAGFINDNKHHRKPSTTEQSKEYSINTWI